MVRPSARIIPKRAMTRWASHGLPKWVTLHGDIGRSETVPTLNNADGDRKIVILDLEGIPTLPPKASIVYLLDK